MAQDKYEVTLIIPAEFKLTAAEVAALKKSIKVQITGAMKTRKTKGAIDVNRLDVNVPPTKAPTRGLKPLSAARKAGRKTPTKKD